MNFLDNKLEISKESIEKLDNLSRAVLGKPAKELTKEQLTFLFITDISSVPTEISVTTSDVRRTEVQYCTNTYGGSMKIDLSQARAAILNTVTNEDNINIAIDRYISLKEVFIKYVMFKYGAAENVLREMSREAQKKDKICQVGRYNNE